MQKRASIMIVVLLSSTTTITAAESAATASAGQPDRSQQAGADGAEKPQTEAPPLPFHTIEGYGGGAITPMAYLVNPGTGDRVWGEPAVAFSSVVLGHKNLQALTSIGKRPIHTTRSPVWWETRTTGTRWMSVGS